MAEPGSPLGRGVTPSAAEQLGIPAGTPVGAALIDAHAGGLGLMAVRDTEVTDPPAVTEVTDPCSRLGEAPLDISSVLAHSPAVTSPRASYRYGTGVVLGFHSYDHGCPVVTLSLPQSKVETNRPTAKAAYSHPAKRGSTLNSSIAAS